MAPPGWICRQESIRLFLIGSLWKLSWNGSDDDQRCKKFIQMGIALKKKETTGAYTEEFEVSVDGQDAEKIDVQIPEKESEEGQVAEKDRERREAGRIRKKKN